MSEKLTDEKLRRRSQADPRFVDQSVIDMATELLALRAERAKLEGELRYARTWIASSVRHHQRDSMLARIDRALAQPAESGATERGETLGEALDRLAGAKP